VSGLSVKWSKRERDLIFNLDEVKGADGHLLYQCLCLGRDGLSLTKELKERGYDLTTLRFSVKKLEVSK